MTDLKDTNMVSVDLKNNSFLKGKYYLSAILYDEDCEIVFDSREKQYWFTIDEENINQFGKIKIDCDWQI